MTGGRPRERSATFRAAKSREMEQVSITFSRTTEKSNKHKIPIVFGQVSCFKTITAATQLIIDCKIVCWTLGRTFHNAPCSWTEFLPFFGGPVALPSPTQAPSLSGRRMDTYVAFHVVEAQHGSAVIVVVALAFPPCASAHLVFDNLWAKSEVLSAIFTPDSNAAHGTICTACRFIDLLVFVNKCFHNMLSLLWASKYISLLNKDNQHYTVIYFVFINSGLCSSKSVILNIITDNYIPMKKFISNLGMK